jgi:hypothetical protein
LLARAGTPGEVLDAVHVGDAARIWSVHGAFALTVRVGPVVELKPASKSAAVGAVRVVDPALISSCTTLPAVIDTLPGTLQLSGAPLRLHCAPAAIGSIAATAQIARPADLTELRLISPPVPL